MPEAGQSDSRGGYFGLSTALAFTPERRAVEIPDRFWMTGSNNQDK